MSTTLSTQSQRRPGRWELPCFSLKVDRIVRSEGRDRFTLEFKDGEQASRTVSVPVGALFSFAKVRQAILMQIGLIAEHCAEAGGWHVRKCWAEEIKQALAIGGGL